MYNISEKWFTATLIVVKFCNIKNLCIQLVVGMRVKRGSDWKWGNEDSRGDVLLAYMKLGCHLLIHSVKLLKLFSQGPHYCL